MLRGVDDVEPGVLEVAPTTDPLPWSSPRTRRRARTRARSLVLVPTESWAGRLRGRLEQRGCAVASGDEQWDRMRAGWPVIVGRARYGAGAGAEGLRRRHHRRR